MKPELLHDGISALIAITHVSMLYDNRYLMPFRSTCHSNCVIAKTTVMSAISPCGVIRLDCCLEWQAVRQEQQQ